MALKLKMVELLVLYLLKLFQKQLEKLENTPKNEKFIKEADFN